VLLVDDNTKWAQLTATALEKEEPQMVVEVVTSANEAVSSLDDEDGDRTDCVLSDYDMPDSNGLELLERVRERRPDLPFILITGKGSEDVAADAIRSGVTDYFMKNPTIDNTPSFANRIMRAVEAERLSRRVKESEELHRTVIQQSRDGVLIADEDGVSMFNDALRELAGYEADELRNMSLPELVHPSERERVENAYEEWFTEGGGKPPETCEEPLVTKNGRTRICEVKSRLIDYKDDTALLSTVRDVTERKRREEETERQKDLNEMVHEVLVKSSTREGIERRFCEGIVEHEPYVFAWIGDLDSEEEFEPQASSSGDGSDGEGGYDYLNSVSTTVTDDVSDKEPSAWVARSGEPRFVQDIEGMFEASWSESALEHGFASVGAVPLAHNGVSYGVLSVYSNRTGVFTATEQELLLQIAETLSYSINAMEKETALLSDEMTELKIQADGAVGYYERVFESLASAGKGDGDRDVSVEIRGTVRTESGALQFFDITGASPEEVTEVEDSLSEIEEVELIREKNSGGSYQFRLSCSPAETHLMDMGVVVRSTTISPHRIDMRVEIPPERNTSAVVEEMESRLGPLSVRMYRRDDGGGFERKVNLNLDELTDKQARALRTAYYRGYFEQPKRNSAEEVADALGISRSTFVQHLRASQRKVFGDLFG